MDELGCGLIVALVFLIIGFIWGYTIRRQLEHPKYDLYDVEGSRLPFVVLSEAGEGIYLCDFFRECRHEEFDDGQDRQWDRIIEAWKHIELCCKQCAEMMALMPTPERAEKVYRTHQHGLIPLLCELRDLMETQGMRFAGEPMDATI